MSEFINPIRIEPIYVDENITQTLNALTRAGFENVVLYGGALRDTHILGKNSNISDYDIKLSLPLNTWRPYEPDEVMETIDRTLRPHFPLINVSDAAASDTLNQSGIFNNISAPKATSTEKDAYLENLFTRISVFLTPELPMLDLKVTRTPEGTATQIKYRTDAPLNAIIMKSNGDFYAHAKFNEHAKYKIYAPREGLTDINKRRYEKLRAKLPGLKLLLSTQPKVSRYTPS